MANVEHLAILKEGVEIWNKWRKESRLPTYTIDLSEADLQNVNLRGANFSSVILRGADLRKSDLSRCTLARADLHDAKLGNAKLKGTDLQDADLHGADLSDCNLQHAHLQGAHLVKSNLSQAEFAGANLHRTDLRGANLRGAELSRCNLVQADLGEANLHGARLKGADLESANLSAADLTDAILDEANLRRANLRSANLTGASLVAINLTEANLNGVITAAIESPREAVSEARPPIEVPVAGASPQRDLHSTTGLGQALEEKLKKEVFFTAMHPREGKVETWSTLLVYAHLFSAIKAIEQDAQRFKDQIPTPKMVQSTASTPIVRGTEITIVPTCGGVIFNPEQVVVQWMEDYHRADFRFKASASLVDDAARGHIRIYVGPLLVGTLKFSMLFSATEAQDPTDHLEFGRMYRQEDIFVSYSHRDTEIVLACKKAYEALGFNVLIDVDTLRSGQDWNHALMRLIDQATIFQLFWSRNSSQSRHCQREWEYASHRSEEGFIRPVYWETPMPPPPDELSKYHFEYMQL